MGSENVSGLKLIGKFVKEVWPAVDCKLAAYINLLEHPEDNILARQALSSINNKRFHALGGSAYALYPGVDMTNTVKFITGLQTISDYLDNLCDRGGVENEQAFRQLHLSMLEALDPLVPLSDYYLYYPYKADNGYLEALVKECRDEVAKLPSYCLVRDRMSELAGLYSSLQTYKHLNKDIREDKLISWSAAYLKDYPDIDCWEFSAATGSTLGLFILFAAAHHPKLTVNQVDLIQSAYFPWISGLHILLDYYIDADEDINSGDLNFTRYYSNLEHCKQRLSFFINRSIESCLKLDYPDFHLTVVRGLLAMYLSDPKALTGLNVSISRKLIKEGGSKVIFYFNLCKLLRHWGKL